MIKNIQFTLLFSLIALLVSAQEYPVNPGVLLYETDGSDADIQIGWVFTNDSDNELGYFWKVSPDANFPDEWTFQVCDQNFCYDFGRDVAAMVNVLEPGAQTNPEKQYVKVVTNGVAGSSIIQICFFDSNDFEAEPLNCSALETSAKELTREVDLALYPNPAVDFFKVSNDASVDKVEIMNIVGRRVFVENHVAGASHSVTNLRKGMYLVSLLNAEGELIKTVRLSKQ